MFSFSVFIQKYLVRKIWRIHWYCSLLFHFDWTYLFWANFVKKVKIVKLGRSLIPRLIWICRIKWWCFSFSVLDRKCFFKQIWSKKLNCHLSWNLVQRFPLVAEVIPLTTQKIGFSPTCFFTVLAQKCWLCNFHTVFLPFRPNSSQTLTLK